MLLDQTASRVQGGHRLRVRQPASQMVNETIDLLLGKIDDPNSPQRRVEIKGRLIVRGSAKVPEGWR